MEEAWNCKTGADEDAGVEACFALPPLAELCQVWWKTLELCGFVKSGFCASNASNLRVVLAKCVLKISNKLMFILMLVALTRSIYPTIHQGIKPHLLTPFSERARDGYTWGGATRSTGGGGLAAIQTLGRARSIHNM